MTQGPYRTTPALGANKRTEFYHPPIEDPDYVRMWHYRRIGSVLRSSRFMWLSEYKEFIHKAYWPFENTRFLSFRERFRRGFYRALGKTAHFLEWIY